MHSEGFYQKNERISQRQKEQIFKRILAKYSLFLFNSRNTSWLGNQNTKIYAEKSLNILIQKVRAS